MDRPGIMLPRIDDDCSPELRERHSVIATEAAAIGKDWAKLLADRKAFLAQDPVDFDPAAGAKIAGREVAILQRDLRLRPEVLRLIGDIQAEQQRLSNELGQRLEAARADIAERLASIGYTNGAPGGAIDRHPEIIGLQMRRAELAQATAVKDVRAQNVAAAEYLTNALQRLQAKAASR